MDIYSEQLEKKTPTTADGMKKIAILIGGSFIALALLVLSFIYNVMILFAFALAVFGIYWFLSGTSIEYEYIVTNGCLDIDKIIAQRKRVNLLSVDVKEFTEFEVYDMQQHDGTTIYAVGGECQTMCAKFSNNQFENAMLLFSTDKKTLESMKPYLRLKK